MNTSQSNKSPKTRRELLNFLWENANTSDINVYKEGSRYACRIGKYVYATYIRNLSDRSLNDWLKYVNDRCFPL